MPKPLYGKGQKKSAGKAKIDDMGWLTLLAGAPEEQLHLLIVEALSDALAPPNIPHDMKDALAASLIEYASGREIDCDETWITLILELASDFGLDLSEGDEGDTAAGVDAEGDVPAVEESEGDVPAVKESEADGEQQPPAPPVGQRVYMCRQCGVPKKGHRCVPVPPEGAPEGAQPDGQEQEQQRSRPPPRVKASFLAGYHSQGKLLKSMSLY